MMLGVLDSDEEPQVPRLKGPERWVVLGNGLERKIQAMIKIYLFNFIIIFFHFQ